MIMKIMMMSVLFNVTSTIGILKSAYDRGDVSSTSYKGEFMKFFKRQMEKAERLTKFVKSNAGKVVAGATVLGTTAANATPTAVTVPTPDYTTFYSVVGVGLGVTLIVGLARKSKGFLR